MLDEQDKRRIKSRLKARDSAYAKVHEHNRQLREILYLTKAQTGCTLEELGEVLGVSRQRVHQILKGE